MKSDTVFGHLVHQFSIHPENLATEALSFILRTSPAASRAFTEFLRPIGLDCPGGLHFEAQRGGLEQSIPDMMCRDEKGRLRVVVENKFWAGLTDNQPVTYIRELFHECPVGVAVLLFVVPKARVQLVWSEVVSRCEAAKIPVGDRQNLGAITAAPLGEEHYIAVTTWGDLLGALSAASPLAGEPDCRNDIAQLQGLCRKMDEEECLPLRGEELTNQEMPRRFINFSNLPFGIIDKAVAEKLCIRKTETNYRHGSGVYIEIGGYTAWVGFDRTAWRSLGVSPIWVNFYDASCPIAEIREKLVQFCRVTPRRCFYSEDGRFVMVPILLPINVEAQRIIDDAVHQLAELKAQLDAPKPSDTPANSVQTHDSGVNSNFAPASQEEQLAVQTILELGAEGGSLNLFGNRDAAGQWRFWTQTDGTTMNELLDEEDLRGLGSLVKTSESVSSLPEAFALLDKYQWRGLTPLQVHPEFRSGILHEVQEKGTPEEVASWSSYPVPDVMTGGRDLVANSSADNSIEGAPDPSHLGTGDDGLPRPRSW